MLAGIYGLLSASFFVSMDAVDVAFTEAAVGAGVFPLLMLTALTVTGRYEQTAHRRPRAAFFLVLVTGALLIFGHSGHATLRLARCPRTHSCRCAVYSGISH